MISAHLCPLHLALCTKLVLCYCLITMGCQLRLALCLSGNPPLYIVAHSSHSCIVVSCMRINLLSRTQPLAYFYRRGDVRRAYNVPGWIFRVAGDRTVWNFDRTYDNHGRFKNMFYIFDMLLRSEFRAPQMENWGYILHFSTLLKIKGGGGKVNQVNHWYTFAFFPTNVNKMCFLG